MMSREDVELAERLTEAVNARDLEWMEATFHPDVEFRSAIAASEGGFYSGIAGMRRYFEDVDSAWKEFEIELQEVHRAGDELVVAYRVTGKSWSGVPLDQLIGQVWTWRDGKLWRNRSYTNPTEALEAVGLAK